VLKAFGTGVYTYSYMHKTARTHKHVHKYIFTCILIRMCRGGMFSPIDPNATEEDYYLSDWEPEV